MGRSAVETDRMVSSITTKDPRDANENVPQNLILPFPACI